MCIRHTVLGCRMSASDDNGSHFLTRDPWPATHDYSRVMTPDYCSFQSGPLSGSALKIKHHHCHKIHRRNKWIKLTLWLKLCRKSLQCLKKDEIMGQRVTSTNPGPRDPLRFVDPLDPWPADPLSSLVGIISSSSRLLLLLVLIVTNLSPVFMHRHSSSRSAAVKTARFSLATMFLFPDFRRLCQLFNENCSFLSVRILTFCCSQDLVLVSHIIRRLYLAK